MGNKVKKNKKNTEPKELCNGVLLSEEFYERKENRILTLLLKGFIVYLLTMGGIGFYLSTLNVEYNEILCHFVILIMAFICAMLYYRLLIENTGYLIMIIIFGLLVFSLKDYINSGFYAVVNMTVNNAAQYFNVDIQRIYTERIADRYLTVTLFVIFAGVVLDILLNVYISRRMQYVTAFCIIMFLNLIPLYMVLEPDLLYSGMILIGISMAVVFKSGKHYSPQVSVKRSNAVFTERVISKRKKKSELFYVYDVKAMLQAGALTVISVLILIIGINLIWQKDSFNTGYETNKYKKLTNVGFSTFFIDGIDGFFSKSYDVGGLNSGVLGAVSSIKLDYKTDLVIQVTPYDYETIYLRSFVGAEYVPYKNYWVRGESSVTAEADALEKSYNQHDKYSAKGKMNIKLVDSDRTIDEYNTMCLPYYSKKIQAIDNWTTEGEDLWAYQVDYYPRLDQNEAVVAYDDYGEYKPYTSIDLYVPEENIETISTFVKENKIEGTKEEIIQAVIDYFSENIPYTVRPGKIPRNQDFVNYFLETGKKGYCSYFASAAVLIFRYMGIPARYAEGYAVDYFQLTSGRLISEAKYEDYYDGYSELGETALVEVDVTDADAHAWVEVYIKDKGWQAVEVTPAGVSEDVEDFWSLLADTLDSQNTDIDMNDQIQGKRWGGSKKILRVLGYLIICFISTMIISIILLNGRKYVGYAIKYSRADTSDKLILKYSGICRKIRKKDAGFKDKLNYRDQIEYLSDGHAGKKSDLNYLADNKEIVIGLLETAGFSNKKITDDELQTVINWLRQAIS